MSTYRLGLAVQGSAQMLRLYSDFLLNCQVFVETVLKNGGEALDGYWRHQGNREEYGMIFAFYL